MLQSSLFLEMILILFTLNQVLGEALHITNEYLTTKERVIMANFKVDDFKAGNSTLRKELIVAMDSGSRMKEQIKALIDDLKAERLLME